MGSKKWEVRSGKWEVESRRWEIRPAELLFFCFLAYTSYFTLPGSPFGQERNGYGYQRKTVQFCF
ncbi:MAG: hypothetical protein KAT86_03185, partial [Candidatus Latescibacteria bacterium]|nr:hypothetical protein [Candidatus Latescibacterota bacterium]